MSKRFLIALASLGTALALAASIFAFTAASAGATAARPAAHRCTSTDGLCDVVVYILQRKGKPNQVWSCYLTRLPAPEGVGVSFPAYTCELP
jgi:hypothetical protein